MERKNSLQEIIYSFLRTHQHILNGDHVEGLHTFFMLLLELLKETIMLFFYISYSGTICAAIVKNLYLRFKSFFFSWLMQNGLEFTLIDMNYDLNVSLSCYNYFNLFFLNKRLIKLFF